ncbi:MAG: YbaN family protein [Pseudomonadota bacterium]|nr:YbaN family protein [Pseudomonadota bacterium]
MRWFWFTCGWLMLVMAGIGAVLPVMPTTIFLILAVTCFARSSPRLEAWLLNHPRYGASLRAWKYQRAISRAGKFWACTGIGIGFLIFLFAGPPGWPWTLAVAAFMLASAGWITTRPTPSPDI